MKFNTFDKNYELAIDIKSVSRIIARVQKKSGDIPWYIGGKTDPWDHVESAMGLTIGNYLENAVKAFKWLKNLQMKDGSWYSSYIDGKPNNKTKETSMSAYIAVGVFQYWLVTTDYGFLRFMWNSVRKAVDFAIAHQGKEGEIYWAISPKGHIDTTALLTASSSVFMSLKCAIAMAYELGIDTPKWKFALKKLKNAILYKTFLFDNSKARFSMDWFYPILCGAISGNLALDRINMYWNKFVVKNLGVRCVSDQPWVTIAESAELVIALNAIGKVNLAHSIFKWIAKRNFEDGTFWCGFTFPNIILWPVEKITWNNAVLLMAADALYDLTSASNMFKHSWWGKKYDLD